MNAVSVFPRFLTRYFGICLFFLRYCGIGYPPMSPSLSGHSFWNSERPAVTLLKQDSRVELSATLRRVIKPSSSWHFKLWPSAFSPFHSAQDRQFWLMTLMNQKPQKPNSWVTIDYKQRKTRNDIPQNHAVEWKFLQLSGAWYSLPAVNTLNCGHRRFPHSIPLRKLYFDWWLL